MGKKTTLKTIDCQDRKCEKSCNWYAIKVCLRRIIPDTFALVATDVRDLRALMNELFLIRINGDGGAPVTHKVSSILANMDADVLDIGHSVIHNNLSLGILVNLPAKGRITSEQLEKRFVSIAEKVIISQYPQIATSSGSRNRELRDMS